MKESKEFKSNFKSATICLLIGFICCFITLILGEVNRGIIILLLGISTFNFIVIFGLIEDVYEDE